MIDLDLYLAFVAATSVLMLIPGPNVALIVANSVAYGTRYGLLTVAGTSAATRRSACSSPRCSRSSTSSSPSPT